VTPQKWNSICAGTINDQGYLIIKLLNAVRHFNQPLRTAEFGGRCANLWRMHILLLNCLRGLRPCYGWNKNHRNANASGGDREFH
jgi:hypothetical protein